MHVIIGLWPNEPVGRAGQRQFVFRVMGQHVLGRVTSLVCALTDGVSMSSRRRTGAVRYAMGSTALLPHVAQGLNKD